MIREDLSLTYAQTGQSQQSNALGMRAMQARVYEKRDEQYILLKAPPAAGKSRALMFIALHKLHEQGVGKVIVTVPETAIGASFANTALTDQGFAHDWTIEPRWNLCMTGADAGALAKSKVTALAEFLKSADRVLVCTHATFRFAFVELGAAAFDDTLIAIDEFHHVSANRENRLGECLRGLMARDKAHVMAMTGSYFRGDTEPVLHPDDEDQFTHVTYTYYEQLNGYEHLKTLSLGHHFYRGAYLDAIGEVLDPNLKTIVHIPNVNAAESTGQKYDEVNAILDALGTYEGRDPQTGFSRVKTPEGKLLKIADLVDDQSERDKVKAALRDTADDRDKVDIIIALGMAKEGFDWIWCEHALTIGYKSSLTEIIQIIGRATRDAPGKSHARFTNLVGEPDADQENVTEAVNNMLKAISASLLMEQVLAPKTDFRPRSSLDVKYEQGGAATLTGFGDHGQAEYQIEIGGLRAPPSERCKKAIQEELLDVQAELYQTKEVIEQAALNPEISPSNVVRDAAKAIYIRKNPKHSDEEAEVFAQHLLVKMALPELIRQHQQEEEEAAQGTETARDERGSGDAALSFVDGLNKLLNVADLDMDLIAAINPFQQAYEVISVELGSKVLADVQRAVVGKRVKVTETEAVDTWPRIETFRARHQRDPDLNAADPVERRYAEIYAWILNRAREKQAAAKAAQAHD